MKLSIFAIKCLIVTLLLVGSGCGQHHPTTADVAGKYTRNTGVLNEELEIKQDGTFTQDVILTNGTAWHLTNKWTLEPSGITFYRMFVTFDVEKGRDVIPPEPAFFFTCYWSKDRLVHSEVGPYVFSK